MNLSNLFCIVTFLCYVKNGLPQIAANIKCQEVQQKTVHAHYNWPFSMDCDFLLPHSDPEKNYEQCKILNSNNFHEDKSTWTISDLATDSIMYKAVLNSTNGDCITADITVKLQEISNSQCPVSLQESYADETIKYVSNTYGSIVTLTCTNDGNASIIPKGANAADFKTTWYKECGFDNIRKDGVRFGTQVKEVGKPDKLMIRGVDFYSVGNYTCAVTYKGQTIFASHYQLCLKQKVFKETSKPNLTCANKTVVALGERAHLQCTGLVVAGQWSYKDFNVSWHDGEQTLCSNQQYGVSMINGRYSCNVIGDNSTLRCENGSQKFTPQPSQTNITMNFYIEDVQEMDFRTKFGSILFQFDRNDTGTVTLQRDWAPYYKHIKNILTPILVILGSAFFAVGLVWYYRLEIRVLSKRFFGKYITVSKPYAFYLLYNYDKEDASNVHVKKICVAIAKKSQEKGYDYVDEQMNQLSGPVEIEAIANNIKNCHCMVVVITKNLIQDNWAKFKFSVSHSSSTPIIFIYTPGCRKLLRHAEGWDVIRQVERVSYTINWTEKMSDTKLGNHLEYAIPKIKKQSEYAAVASQSSSCATSVHTLSPV